MPYESEKQRRAMFAAASGHGQKGIPMKAARSFIRHSGDTPPMKRKGMLHRAKRMMHDE